MKGRDSGHFTPPQGLPGTALDAQVAHEEAAAPGQLRSGRSADWR